MRLELERSGNALCIVDMPGFLHVLAQSAAADRFQSVTQLSRLAGSAAAPPLVRFETRLSPKAVHRQWRQAHKVHKGIFAAALP